MSLQRTVLIVFVGLLVAILVTGIVLVSVPTTPSLPAVGKTIGMWFAVVPSILLVVGAGFALAQYFSRGSLLINGRTIELAQNRRTSGSDNYR
jgi:hypothetical protein